MRYKNGILHLISFEKPENNYIRFESINADIKTVYFFDFSDKTLLKIGRSYDCDIRLPDITISRSHCYIKLQDNSFYIQDNYSKFGTLLLLNNSIGFLNRRKIAIQIGKAYLIFLVSVSCYNFFRCIK